MSAPLVRVERDGPHVGRITLDRPEQRNAISTAMLGELVAALAALATDPEVRTVVLAGEGPDFCAGADFRDLTIMQPPGEDYGTSFEEAIRAIAEHPNPVIAQVQGAAFGAGCQVVVACDLAVAAEDAKLGIPAAKLGLLINYENLQRLVLAIGPKRAGWLMYGGRAVSGTTASQWGLVNEAVPADQLASRVHQVAERIARGAPLSVRGSKRGIGVVMENLSLDRDIDGHHVAAFDVLAAAAFGSEDLREGLTAFRERRPPEFTGR